MNPTPDDDDKTVIRPITKPPNARFSNSTAQAVQDLALQDDATHALPVGTKISEFEVTEKVGEGGFSIVYAAWDHSLDRKVALKEYMPQSIAARKTQLLVNARSEKHIETFEAGLRSFINEAKLLAQFDHPSLVKVFRFWEANGTAYMVMPFYEGTTLKDTVRALQSPPNEAWLLSLLAPLTEALKVIHLDQCYHRDIAPDNVMLLADTGQPLLLDFGAARRVIGDMTQALTVILKSGYAPVEQYAEIPNMKQGSWTDVYALAATVHWTITGKTPPAAVGRMLSDSYTPLAKSAAGQYSEQFLRGIDKALAVKPELRTQTIEAFRKDIGIGQPTQISKPVKISSQTALPRAGHALTKWSAAGLVALTLASIGLWSFLSFTTSQPQAELSPTTPSVSTPPPEPKLTEQATPASPTPTTNSAVPEPQIEPPPPLEKAPPSRVVKEGAPKATPTEKSLAIKSTKSDSNRAQCADIMQRISLGDTSPELIAQLDKLHCK